MLVFFRNTVIMTLLLLIVATTIRAGESPKSDGLYKYIEQARMDWEIPGLAVAVVKDDSVVFVNGFGTREQGKNLPVDAHTLFAIASNSKVMTATMIGMLAERDSISLDEPVVHYLPGFRLYDAQATAKITLRDMLSHRSGLATFGGDLSAFGTTNSSAELLYRLRFQKPTTDFRTTYGYSNLMYLAAGTALEKVTGKTWRANILQRILQPLEMNETRTSVADLAVSRNHAVPHIRAGEKIITAPYDNVDNLAPAAAVISSVNDLSHWLRCQLADGEWKGKQVIPREVVMEVRKAHTLLRVSENSYQFNPNTHLRAYGLGWGLSDYRGRLLVNHTGGLNGMLSWVGLVPEENLGIAVLTNFDDQSLFSALPYWLIDQYLGGAVEDWSAKALDRHRKGLERAKKAEAETVAKRVAGTTPTHPLAQYTGQYENPLYGPMDIRVEDGRLVIDAGANPGISGELTHWQYNTFRCQWNDPVWDKSFVYFDLSDEGTIRQFRVSVRPDWIDTLEYTFTKTNE